MALPMVKLPWKLKVVYSTLSVDANSSVRLCQWYCCAIALFDRLCQLLLNKAGTNSLLIRSINIIWPTTSNTRTFKLVENACSSSYKLLRAQCWQFENQTEILSWKDVVHETGNVIWTIEGFPKIRLPVSNVIWMKTVFGFAGWEYTFFLFEQESVYNHKERLANVRSTLG